MSERSTVRRVSAKGDQQTVQDDYTDDRDLTDKIGDLNKSIRSYQRSSLTYESLQNIKDGIGPIPMLEFTARATDGGQPVRLAIDLEWLDPALRNEVVDIMCIPLARQCRQHLIDIANHSASALTEFPDE